VKAAPGRDRVSLIEDRFFVVASDAEIRVTR
jgi:hypothetical protein